MIVVTHGNRPSSITAKLYKNGSDTGKSVTLNSSNGWKGTFTGVEDASGYSVQESSVPTGYTASYSGDKSSGFTITNTLKTTSVKVGNTIVNVGQRLDFKMDYSPFSSIINQNGKGGLLINTKHLYGMLPRRKVSKRNTCSTMRKTHHT